MPEAVTLHCATCHTTTQGPMADRPCPCGGTRYVHNRSVGCRICEAQT